MTQGPFHYRHSGLGFSSAIELPEWSAFASEDTQGDVRIVLSDEPCPDCPAGDCVVEDGVLRFAVEGIGGWQVEDGHTIRIHPGLTSDLPELRLFTLGSAWGTIGYQRGFAMWHGSAVERGGKAVLFCGDSGAGKSTMAAALCARGARLVTDDLGRVEPADNAALIHPSSTRLKLWRGAIDHFGWSERIVQRDYFRDDKFHSLAEGAAAGREPIALSAVVSLEEGEDVTLERLVGGEALRTIFAQTMYRPEMLEALDRWAEQGALAAKILAQCPAYRLRRPRDFAQLDTVCEAAERLWE